MNLGGGACSELRSHHRTPGDRTAWVTEGNSLKKKHKAGTHIHATFFSQRDRPFFKIPEVNVVVTLLLRGWAVF